VADRARGAALLPVPVAAGYAAGTGRAPLAIALVLATLVAFALLLWPERAAIALLVVLPFGVYPAAVGGFSVFLALPVALGAAGGLAILPRRHGPILLPLLPFAGLLAAAVASTAHSGDPTTGASRVLYLASFAMLAWALAAALHAGLLTPATIAKALAAGAALAAIALLSQFVYGMVAGRLAVTTWLAERYALFGGQRSGATQTPNWWIPSLSLTRAIFPYMAAPSAGVAMMMGLLCAVWLRGRTAWATLAVALIGAALLVTFSRQAWIGALAGLFVLGARGGRRGVLVLLGLLVMVVLFVPVPGHDATFASYLATSADTSTTSTGTRLGLWHDAIGFIGQRPLLGIGPGQYAALNPDPGAHPIYYAHDVVLDVAVELGLLGAVAFVALFAAGIGAAWRRQADLGAALLVAYLAAGLFDDVLYFPRNGYMLAAAFALTTVGRAR
jgi:O-antigen ligase